MIETCKRIGTGKPDDDDPIRPDTTAKSWQRIEESETEIVIEILD